MYPHVVQFEARSQQFKLERQLICERKQARAGKAVNRPSLLAKIRSALAERGPRNPAAPSPRGSTDLKRATLL